MQLPSGARMSRGAALTQQRRHELTPLFGGGLIVPFHIVVFGHVFDVCFQHFLVDVLE